MSKISVELPVKLEELCQFTFNFNNLIKIIDYLHQNNLSLQQELKDMDKRLISVEGLKSDIEELKIKSINIEKTNENLNRSFSNLQEHILKYDTKISEMKKQTNEAESKLKKYEILQIDQQQNLNHLNKMVEDNENALKELNNELNTTNNNLSKISDKINENENKEKEEFENINKEIKEINTRCDSDHKEIENINSNIEEMNDSIKILKNNFEKKNSDVNDRILNIINDVADIKNNIENIHMGSYDNKYGKGLDINITESLNKDMNSSNLFKISMDQIEDIKNKFNKLKEDYDLNKEKQKKEYIIIKKDLNEIIEEYNNLKKTVENNAESLENNYYNYINLKNEETELKQDKDDKKPSKSESIDIKQLNYYLSKFVPFDVFKKLSDNVRILTSTMNLKSNREEIENYFKKFNQRLENIEMIQQGQTHGPRTRINLGLVNLPKNADPSNISINYEELDEIEYFYKKIEKKINENIIKVINKEINNVDLSANPKIVELDNNCNNNSNNINSNNKNIIDIRNILLSNPSQNDFVKLKNDLEALEEECRANKLKIIEIARNIEGSTEDNDEDTENALPGTIKDKINFLNRASQTLNLKLVSLENKGKSLTKEVKDEIKQNLKNETIKIMQQFKTRLECFTTKFEYELNNKIDQINLSDFENKMNNKFHNNLKEKLDKNDLRKNNNIIKKKIDNLESKISKTFVDTIIDLQMDEQPLIIKKAGNGVDVCASCNQPFAKNTYYGGEFFPSHINNRTISRVKNMNRSLMNFTQPSNCKLVKNTDKNLNLNLSLGQNKLPDIIPTITSK